MSGITFRRGIRENVALVVGMIGPSGGGKTMSAMLLASGMAGGKPFAVIDTEARRALHYAEQFTFDHADLKPPFRPQAYEEAIKAADAAGYPVILVDSTSHEHAGEGGLLDWHEEELDRMAGNDWKRREAVNMAAWIKPKMAHKAFVQRLLQIRAHLVLCFRAEEKVEMVREDGKTKIVPKQSVHGLYGWVPVCEKNMPYELTASFLLTADAPGVPKPIKLQAQHRPFFPLDKPISKEAGAALAAWAAGAKRPDSVVNGDGGQRDAASSRGVPPVTPEAEERAALLAKVDDLGKTKSNDTKRSLWKTYIGENVSRERASVDGLRELVAALQKGAAA